MTVKEAQELESVIKIRRDSLSDICEILSKNDDLNRVITNYIPDFKSRLDCTITILNVIIRMIMDYIYG